jgi:cell division septal protein FtsQ
MPLRLKLAIAAALATLGLGAWLVVRDSSLFAVHDVTIVGLSADAQPVVSAQLEAAAQSQTTTDFSVAALRESVARFTLIDGLSARTQGSHGVLVTVSERRTAVRLDVGGAMIPLDSSGAVITGLRHSPRVATVRSAHLPVGGRSRDPLVALALRVLGAAPAPLRARVVSVTLGHGELTVYLHRGPRLIFGDASLPHAKWDAAAAVLSDHWSLGATYVDVRIPSRPAAQVADPNTTVTASLGGAATLTAGGLATAATALSPAVLGPSSST